MKLTQVVSAVALCAGQTLAGLNQMEHDFEELSRVNGSARALPASTLANLQSFACWCHFEDQHGKGRGRPLNEIDALCKVLHDGYECAMLDNDDAAFGECIPWEEQYNSATGFGGSSLAEECDAVNAVDTCAARACKVEGHFVTAIFDLFMQGIFADPALKKDNGFMIEQECPTKSGQPSDKACCGIYPIRFPFKSYGGERGCCGVKTYSLDVLTCCPDGIAKMSC